MPQQTSTTRRRRGGAPVRNNNTPLLIGIGVIAVVFVLAIVVAAVSSTGSAQPRGSTGVPSTGRTWGQETAKVTIDEWSDFQ